MVVSVLATHYNSVWLRCEYDIVRPTTLERCWWRQRWAVEDNHWYWWFDLVQCNLLQPKSYVQKMRKSYLTCKRCNGLAIQLDKYTYSMIRREPLDRVKRLVTYKKEEFCVCACGIRWTDRNSDGHETAINIYTVIILAPISFLFDTMHLEVDCYC